MGSTQSTWGISKVVLRKKITLVSQDPVLFNNTLRFNLDPFDEYEDAQIWEVLESCSLKQLVLDTMPEKLSFKVEQGGENLSVGTRQLVCLARALLRNSKIILLDEFSSNIDSETEKVVQKSIDLASKSSTLLTIAHRLSTCISNDKVMVMDAGTCAEFDTPHNLLKDNTTIFSKLVDDTGETNAQKLRSLARDRHNQIS